MSKNVLIALGGLPASGKSTYAEMLCEINPTFQRVCPDLIRKAFYGDENIQGDGKRVFKTAFRDLKEYGSVGVNAIFDATNINANRRKEFVKEMRPYFDIIIFKWITTPASVCYERNFYRDRQVPSNIIKRMSDNFEEPTMDEGWDYIEKIENY